MKNETLDLSFINVIAFMPPIFSIAILFMFHATNLTINVMGLVIKEIWVEVV
jgi:hypothetical protein